MRYANEDPELLALVHRYVTPRELTILLEGGWRERKTTAWLIAVARRTEFRERLGEMLLASEVCFAGSTYCVTFATFATPVDADLLAAYLDRNLRRPDLYYDQSAALGALLHLRRQAPCRSPQPDS